MTRAAKSFARRKVGGSRFFSVHERALSDYFTGNTSKSRSRRAAPSTKGESSGSSPCSSFSADGDRSPGVPTEAGTETIEPAGPAPAAAGYGSCAVGISRQRALELVPKGAPDVVRYREVCQTPEEMGKAFYIQNYVLRHAGEPKSAIELAEVEWIKHDSMQHIIVGIGLAGMTNLTSNPELRRVALEKRGMTLELLRRSLQVPGSLEYELSVRNIILLAQFEVGAA